jgi:hypothetical protein
LFNLTLFSLVFCFLCWFQFRPVKTFSVVVNDTISDPWGDDFIRVLVRDEVPRYEREADTTESNTDSLLSTDDLLSQITDDILTTTQYDLSTPYENWTLVELRQRCQDVNINPGRMRKSTLVKRLLEHDLALSTF